MGRSDESWPTWSSVTGNRCGCWSPNERPVRGSGFACKSCTEGPVQSRLTNRADPRLFAAMTRALGSSQICLPYHWPFALNQCLYTFVLFTAEALSPHEHVPTFPHHSTERQVLLCQSSGRALATRPAAGRSLVVSFTLVEHKVDAFPDCTVRPDMAPVRETLGALDRLFA